MRSIKRWTMSMVLVTGCAGSVAEQVEVERDAPPPLAAERRVDGLRYTALRPNHPEQFVYRAPEGPAQVEDDADLDTLSDDELAQYMVAFTEIDGWVYRVEPELELVRRIRSQQRRDVVPAMPRRQPTSDGPVAALAAPLILGNADWGVRRDNTSYPMSTIVQMDDETNGCTGVLIGRSTILTASHCVFDGTNFTATNSFRPGSDGGDADPHPFGTCGCHGIWAAGGGKNDTGRDYAVVDFRYAGYGCNDFPGDGAGWMGVRILSNEALRGLNIELYGYPTEFGEYPQLHGMGGPINGVFSSRLEYQHDSVGGHSGAGLFFMENGWPNVVGIHSGGTFDFGGTNYGARITNAFWSAVQAWAVEY